MEEVTDTKIAVKGLQELRRIAKVRAGKKMVALTNAERKLKLAEAVLEFLKSLDPEPYGQDNVNALIREFEVKRRLILEKISKIQAAREEWLKKAEEYERRIRELRGESGG